MLIEGVDLAKACKDADQAFSKIAQARIVDYVKGLKVQAHNLRMKSMRLFNESKTAGESAESIEKRIAMIVAGDWEGIEPFDLADKTEKTDKKD